MNLDPGISKSTLDLSGQHRRGQMSGGSVGEGTHPVGVIASDLATQRGVLHVSIAGVIG